MTAPRDPDRLIHGFLLEGEEYLQDQVYDEVRAAIEHKRQRAFFGPWRTPIMNKVLIYGLGAAAAVVVMLVIGSQVFGRPNNVGGGDATPTPQPTATTRPIGTGTLASGSFTAPLGEFGEEFDIEAIRNGDDVSGTMQISNPAGGEGAYSVDVQCARTTDDGFLLIGGEVTESTYEQFIENGAYVVIALAPGTPVRMLWAVDVLVTDEVPAPAESCSAFVETLLSDRVFDKVDVDGRPIVGDVALGG
ncbi:MAG TPA: hypothetical protein VJY85_13525 [Candidatus Limnocylindria bacterium]|nr:hypothetical protein [Candidatus Limnocylindria bacterium]